MGVHFWFSFLFLLAMLPVIDLLQRRKVRGVMTGAEFRAFMESDILPESCVRHLGAKRWAALAMPQRRETGTAA